MRRENGSPIRLEMGLVNPELEPGRFKSSPWQNTNGNGNGNGRKAQRQVLFFFRFLSRDFAPPVPWLTLHKDGIMPPLMMA